MSGNEADSFKKTLITTFLAVFVAEVGDKTQIATLLLSADTGRPLIVFLAASLALIISSLIGVLMGKLIAKKVSPIVFNRVAGVIMISLSVIIILDLANHSDLLQGIL